MKTSSNRFVSLLLSVLFSASALAQTPENWSRQQLLEPSGLAATLQSGKNLPLIFAVGPGATIPCSIHIGPTSEAANLARLIKEVKGLPKNKAIVVYCGCCPFEHCPNVRPAVAALKAQGFTQFKLLNLSHNLKTDWLDKGYPTTISK